MRWSVVVAQDRNGIIGQAGKLPWQGDLPADMKHFRELTTGHVIVMGRKTYQSVGRPLPNRVNLVLTHDEAFRAPGCIVVNSLKYEPDVDDPEGQEVFAIGGAELYRLVWPWVSRVYLTRVEADFKGDTKFPKLSMDWRVMSEEKHQADDRNKYPYTFQIYEQRLK